MNEETKKLAWVQYGFILSSIALIAIASLYLLS